MDINALAAIAEKKLETSSGVFKDFRATHLELFRQKGFQMKNPEAYKFTNISTFMNALEYTPYEGEETRFEDFMHEKFISLVFIDGELKSPKPTIPGLKLSSIEENFSELAVQFKTEHPLSSLHYSLLSQGLVIEVAAKTKLEKPIRITQITTRSGILAPTLFIKANKFSEASIFEEIFDQGVSCATLSETYLSVDLGAKVEHVQLSRGSSTAVVHSTTKCFIEKDATYRNMLFNLSGKLNRRNLNLELTQSGAHGESYNLYLTNGSEHSDIHTTIEHKAADTTSNQIAKGILDGESKGIFTGKIHIHPQSQRVVSGQINKNLLLSLKAQAHSQPQLEIFADDVKCSHGSTTGQLSAEEVFYFQARGIPADQARTLLAHGFGLEVVHKIESKALREVVEELVMNMLKEKFQLGGKS